MIAKMAFRNIMRNRRRSFLAAISVFFAIYLIVVMSGVTDGFLDSMVRNFTKSDVGHVNIVTDAYRSRESFYPVNEFVHDSEIVADAAREAVESAGIGVKLTVERTKFGVILANGDRSKYAFGVGGDPETEKSMLMLDRNLIEGSRYIEKPGDMIMGIQLAETLGFKLGDTVKVVTQKADYGLGFKKFTLAGIFKTGVNAFDGAMFQVSLDDARSLLATEGGAHQILVMLDDYTQADAAALAIETGFAQKGTEGLSAASWTEMGDYPKLILMADGVYGWMFAVIALLGAIIIANVITMSVLERTKEIGILKSMGMNPSSVFFLFLIEGSILGALGSGLAVISGIGTNMVVAKEGFDMTSAMASFTWPLDNVIYPTIDPVAMIAFFVLGVIVSAVVATVPSYKAAKMKPIDAIRSAV